MISPILTYNSEIWSVYAKPDFKTGEGSQIEKAHLQFCKRNLKLYNKASNIACRAELGRVPLNITINQKIPKYILYIQSKDERSLVKQAFLMPFDLHYNGKNSFHSHLMNMSKYFKLTDFKNDFLDIPMVKSSVSSMKQEYISYWQNTLQHSQKLEFYRSFRTDHTSSNDSNWHQFFDVSNSYLHRQQYIRSRKKAHFGRRALYYSNSTATTQLLLLTLSGNVESNPSPQGSHNNSSKTLCAYYAKAMRRNQNGVRCSSCLAVFHSKCTKMSKNELSYCRREGTWICFTCMPQFSDSFFDDLSPSTAYDLSSNGEDFEIVEEHLVDSVDWFSRNVNGYYKSNLKIAYFNVNSLQHKLDEVKNMLNKSLFDIPFISETKLDGTTSDSFLQQP